MYRLVTFALACLLLVACSREEPEQRQHQSALKQNTARTAATQSPPESEGPVTSPAVPRTGDDQRSESPSFETYLAAEALLTTSYLPFQLHRPAGQENWVVIWSANDPSPFPDDREKRRQINPPVLFADPPVTRGDTLLTLNGAPVTDRNYTRLLRTAANWLDHDGSATFRLRRSTGEVYEWTLNADLVPLETFRVSRLPASDLLPNYEDFDEAFRPALEHIFHGRTSAADAHLEALRYDPEHRLSADLFLTESFLLLMKVAQRGLSLQAKEQEFATETYRDRLDKLRATATELDPFARVRGSKFLMALWMSVVNPYIDGTRALGTAADPYNIGMLVNQISWATTWIHEHDSQDDSAAYTAGYRATVDAAFQAADRCFDLDRPHVATVMLYWLGIGMRSTLPGTYLDHHFRPALEQDALLDYAVRKIEQGDLRAAQDSLSDFLGSPWINNVAFHGYADTARFGEVLADLVKLGAPPAFVGTLAEKQPYLPEAFRHATLRRGGAPAASAFVPTAPPHDASYVLVSDQRFTLTPSDYTGGSARVIVSASSGLLYKLHARASFSPLLTVSQAKNTQTIEGRPREAVTAELYAIVDGPLTVDVTSRFDTPSDVALDVRGYLPLLLTDEPAAEIVRDVRPGFVLRGAVGGENAHLGRARKTYRFRVPIGEPLLLSFDHTTFGHYMTIDVADDFSQRPVVPEPLRGRLAYLMPPDGRVQDVTLSVYADLKQRSNNFAIQFQPIPVLKAPREKQSAPSIPDPWTGSGGERPRSAMDQLFKSRGADQGSAQTSLSCGGACTRLPDSLGSHNGGGKYVAPLAISLSDLPANRSQTISFSWSGEETIVFTNGIFGIGEDVTLQKCQNGRRMLYGDIGGAFSDGDLSVVFFAAPMGAATSVWIGPVVGDWEQGPAPPGCD